MTKPLTHFDFAPDYRLTDAIVECPHCGKLQHKMVRPNGRTYRRCRHCERGFAVVQIKGAYRTEWP